MRDDFAAINIFDACQLYAIISFGFITQQSGRQDVGNHQQAARHRFPTRTARHRAAQRSHTGG
ncbi:hypothetical protein BQ8794_10462 [Mesorhizobium prunaredense]|uniref:Uncharacterized protein n=1 Tax=Mesorhizobium prunaredense TaxID=1631249 RepID=A0A1R3UZN3_9HYPH|nr:hypothetical protein BQ8794_10462 [Mesorhizobium prunaredense]